MGIRTKQLPLGMYVEWIDTNGQPYLVRTHLTPWKWWPFKLRIYLHKFYRPDADRVFHDHPWSFRTLILYGGYDEVSHEPQESLVAQTNNGLENPPSGLLIPDTLRWLSYRARRPQHAHRITRLHTRTVLTLIFRGERERDWGFWCPPANYQDDTGEVIVSRVNNPTMQWKWVYWRDYLDITDPNQGEAY
jgi:hypothetical protein